MFGSHLSIAGSMANAPREAERLTFDTVQVFTKNQRQWNVPALADAARDEWLAELARLGWTSRVVSHNSYLANLASPDDTLWNKSLDLMRDEFSRAHTLGIPYLVAHPGAHVGSGVEAGIERIAKAVAILLKETRGSAVKLCLENTAGGGSTLGRSLEELAAMKQAIEEEAGADAQLPGVKSKTASRIAFCIDTCHALAAGYDLDACEPGAPGKPGRKRTRQEGEAAAERFFREFDEVCGLGNLAVLHLNDSKGGRGSHLDRHAHLGTGNVAVGVFAAIVNHRGLAGVPKILETPKENDKDGVPMDTINLRLLRSLVTGAEAGAEVEPKRAGSPRSRVSKSKPEPKAKPRAKAQTSRQSRSSRK
ncbi:MAG TPA: deoxyribonuclease IV [Phycisphaerales bacterium]|nr:deoxyribonuclease IV [Phycisphaerales bacterium]